MRLTLKKPKINHALILIQTFFYTINNYLITQVENNWEA
jgi:hypothetical protein